MFNAELRAVDRTGAGKRVGTARLFSYYMSENPVDGRTLAAAHSSTRALAHRSCVLIDLTKDSLAPLTRSRGFAGVPVWSADGKQLAYAYQPPGQMDDVYVGTWPRASFARGLRARWSWSTPPPGPTTAQSLLVFTADAKGHSCRRGRSRRAR